MTYKVFIVEDEYLIRDSLRNQLLQLSQELPISYSGEAADGEMALATVTDMQPDIILTDIKMPFMDGLTFAKEARKRLPWTRIVFISGFDDFAYTKAAIQIQVDDYLLKPIKNNELAATLRKIVQLLDEQKQQSKVADNSDEMVLELKKNHFLNGLFKGELSMTEALEQVASFQRSFVGKKMTVLLANNRYNQNFEDYTRFTQYLNYLFADDQRLIYASVSSRFIKFLLFDTTKEAILEGAYQLAQTLIHELEQRAEDDLAVAIGPVVDRVSEIPHSYRQARGMLETYGILRTEKIISYEDDMKEGELSPTHPFKLDLAKELAVLTQEEIPDFIQSLAAEQNTPERTRMYRYFILTELNSLLQKKEHVPVDLQQKLADPEKLVIIASHFTEYHHTLTEIVNFLVTTKIHPAMSKYQSVINHALDFINENYTDPDISLNMVAEEVALSPSHFSTIFSQSLGKTFIEYLTDRRINLAKQLLKESNQRLGEIAMEIGYNDPNYFSFLFKKKQGISPKEYRQQ